MKCYNTLILAAITSGSSGSSITANNGQIWQPKPEKIHQTTLVSFDETPDPSNDMGYCPSSHYNPFEMKEVNELSNGANGQSNHLHGGSGMLNLDRNLGTSTAKMDEDEVKELSNSANDQSNLHGGSVMKEIIKLIVLVLFMSHVCSILNDKRPMFTKYGCIQVQGKRGKKRYKKIQGEAPLWLHSMMIYLVVSSHMINVYSNIQSNLGSNGFLRSSKNTNPNANSIANKFSVPPAVVQPTATTSTEARAQLAALPKLETSAADILKVSGSSLAKDELNSKIDTVGVTSEEGTESATSLHGLEGSMSALQALDDSDIDAEDGRAVSATVHEPEEGSANNHKVFALDKTGMNSKIDSNIDVKDTRAAESADTLHEVEDPATTREVSNMDDGTVEFKGIKAEAATVRGLKGLASIRHEDSKTGLDSKTAAAELATTLLHESESSVDSREVSTVMNNGILGHEVEVYVEEADLEASANAQFPLDELEVVAAAPLPIARILNSGASCGEEAVVHCDNGFEVYVNGTLTGLSCLDACGGANNTNCCAGNGVRQTYYGYVYDCDTSGSVCPDGGRFECKGKFGWCYKYTENACENFTGSVCPDGSCMGFDACYLAGSDGGSVGLISDGSCNGTEACYELGYEDGTVGSVSNQSCIGEYACQYLGRDEGNVGSVSGQSCIGYEACYELGGDGGNVGSVSDQSCIGDDVCDSLGYDGGNVGSISGQSCIGSEACYYLGSIGTVGSVSDQSCVGKEACNQLGDDSGNVGIVSGQSCIGEEACKYLGDTGPVESVSSQSCNGTQACYNLGYRGNNYGSQVGSICQSCIGNYSCSYLAGAVFLGCSGCFTEPGSIGDISGSCTSEYACYQVASNSSNNNITGITGCCTDPYECQGDQTDSDLYQSGCVNFDPLACLPEAPSEAPTSPPTALPTVAPSTNPSSSPTHMPSVNPSQQQTQVPTVAPSTNPSSSPTHMPSVNPSQQPTQVPTVAVSLAPSGPSVQTKSPSSNSNTDAPTLAPGSSTKSSKASGETSKMNSSSTKSAKLDIKSKASSKASSKSSKKSIKVEGEESEETTLVINETAKVEVEEPTEAIEETTKDKEEEKSFMGIILEVIGNVLGGWGR